MSSVAGPVPETGIAALAAAIRNGRLRASTLVEQCLARIGKLNPATNAFMEVMADRARAEAAAVDRAVAAGRDPGPLAGVPFGVKDNYDIAGRVTTAGSIVYRDQPPARADAVLIRRAREGGAILLGAQTMDELAYGFTTENAHYGDVRNPLDPARSAGGSSGGSAAAVAAGLCDFALGTDTNGSIRVPASFCGIFGLKPTFGRLPRTGTFPFVHDLDHLGLFARSVDDLALVYDVLQGHDPGDLACSPRPPEPALPRLQEGFSGSVGVLGGWFEGLADAQGRAATRMVAEGLGAAGLGAAGAGATAVVDLPGARRARAAAFILTCASGGSLHSQALRSRAADFDPATRDRLLAGTLVPAHFVLQAQRFRAEFREQVMAAFRHHDLLLAPATPCAAPLLGQATIHVAGQDLPTRPNIGLLTQPLSFVGLPVVTVPVAQGGLPIGVQIVAPPWAELRALQAAAQLERMGLVQCGEL